MSFLLELKSKNICINKDYWILGSSQIWLCGFQHSTVGRKRVLIQLCPSLPWCIACWPLVDVALCVGLWDLVVSRTFSCLQKFVCDVPMGRNTGSAHSLFWKSLLFSRAQLWCHFLLGCFLASWQDSLSLAPLWWNYCFPCVWPSPFRKASGFSWLTGGTSPTLWEIVIWLLATKAAKMNPQ